MCLAVERAQTRFGGLTSVLESPAAVDPSWLARTKKDLGADGTFIDTMAVWMTERDIRLAGVAVDTGRASPLGGPPAELASNASRLRMRRTCHERRVSRIEVAMLGGVTVNLAGVAGVLVRRMLQLAFGARTGDQLDEARRMGPRAGLWHEPCVGDAFSVDEEAGLRLAVTISVSEGTFKCREVQCRCFDVGVAAGAAVECRAVSGGREATVVALMDMMATVFMGDERVSVVAASRRAFLDVRFE